MTTTPAPEPALTRDDEGSRYLLRVGERVVAYSEYELDGDHVVFVHTVVDEDVKGQGMGAELVSRALADVRARGLRVIARCPFVRGWLRRHHDYDDIVDPVPPTP